MTTNTTIPAPVSWAPSSSWDGNDGLWNTFTLSVGTPPQEFHILPSTSGQETWLPSAEGCTTADPSNPGYCGSLRGVLPVNGVNISGFFTNQSGSWDLQGLYELDAVELELGYSGNAVYGLDTVALADASTNVTQSNQAVASMPGLDFFLGVLGLGPKSINLTSYNDPIPSFMSDLVSNGTIPSLSWGYTAGAHYRNQSPASLTLGGYDSNRFQATDLTFTMNVDDSRRFQVGVQKIIGENTLGGSGVNLLPTATYSLVDSTVPHIWLPDDAIQAFVDNFGLTYDNNTDLFLINDTMRQQMLSTKPTVTFVLGTSTVEGSGNTENIELPYAAFDLQASYPFYTNATNYFPIRRATSDTQYTIGRAFLQEAYLIADFERSNFTVAQATFPTSTIPRLVAIHATTTPDGGNGTAATTSSASPHALSGGVIAGVAIGAVAILAGVGVLVWYLMRRNRRKNAPVPSSEPFETETAFLQDKKDQSPYTHLGYELPSESGIFEVSDQIRKPSELASTNVTKLEMEGDMGRARGRPGMVEMPAGEGRRYELAGSEVNNG